MPSFFSSSAARSDGELKQVDTSTNTSAFVSAQGSLNSLPAALDDSQGTYVNADECLSFPSPQTIVTTDRASPMMMDVVRVVGPPLPRQLAHLSQGLYRAVIQLLAAHALGLVCCPIALIWGPLLLSCKLTAPETAATPNSQEPASRQSTARTSVSTSGQNAKDSKDISKQISASATSKANACLDPLSTVSSKPCFMRPSLMRGFAERKRDR